MPTGTAGTFAYNLVSVQYQTGAACLVTLNTSATVVVRPTPTASVTGTTTVCAGASTNITFNNPMTLPVTVNYTLNSVSATPVTVPASGSTTVAVPTGTAGTYNYELVSVAYTTTPTCQNPILGSALVTVNYIPTVNQPAPQAVCHNSQTTTINFSGTATSYTWTNNNTNIGLGPAQVILLNLLPTTPDLHLLAEQ